MKTRQLDQGWTKHTKNVEEKLDIEIIISETEKCSHRAEIDPQTDNEIEDDDNENRIEVQ